MMKTTLAVIFCMVIGFSQNQQTADKIIGIYWSPKKDGKVEIYQENGRYYGKTIWAEKPRSDDQNPNPSLRSASIVGLVFLKDFAHKKGEYVDGTIYDPDNGKTYSSKMWLEGEDTLE